MRVIQRVCTAYTTMREKYRLWIEGYAFRMLGVLRWLKSYSRPQDMKVEVPLSPNKYVRNHCVDVMSRCASASSKHPPVRRYEMFLSGEIGG